MDDQKTSTQLEQRERWGHCKHFILLCNSIFKGWFTLCLQARWWTGGRWVSYCTSSLSGVFRSSAIRPKNSSHKSSMVRKLVLFMCHFALCMSLYVFVCLEIKIIRIRMERSSSAVEWRTLILGSPGSNPLCCVSKLDHIRSPYGAPIHSAV